MTEAEIIVQQCCLDLLECYANQGYPVRFHKTEMGFGFELHGETIVLACVSRGTSGLSHDAYRVRKAEAEAEGNVFMHVNEISILRAYLQEVFGE